MEIMSIRLETLGEELYNMIKALDEDLHLRNDQSLKYKGLCVHPNIELPLGYMLQKFNTFSEE